MIDAIIDEFYYFWTETSSWNSDDAKESAHRVLEIVEEFQNTRTKLNQWRASD
jgi:hypothetical protein